MQSIGPISLRQWVSGTLNTLNNTTSSSSSSSGKPSSAFNFGTADQKLSSEEFLIPALKVARSLAEQIYQVEEATAATALDSEELVDNGNGNSNGNNGGQYYLPVPGNNWADQVAVYLSSGGTIDGESFADPQLPSDDTDDCNGMKNSTNGIDHQGKGGETNIPYLSVASAKLLSPSSSSNIDIDHGKDKDNAKTQRIYSLGLVLYEIFSGGESHPEIVVNTNNDNDKSMGELEHDDNVEQQQPPIPSSAKGGTINFTKKLSLIDNNDDNGGGGGDNNSSETPVDRPLHEIEGRRGKRGKRASLNSHTDSKSSSLIVSSDPLKSKGLPGPLCDLIANMISCVDGDLSGDDAYCQMWDVLGDISRMLEKPNRFLYDLDLEKLSRNDGLQMNMNETMFGREAELATLQESYRRAISGKSECGIIAGLSGTGKSTLSNRLGSYATMSGGIFLSGKFDLQQAKPFSALTTAFNQYCDMLLDEGETARVKEVATKLHQVLGKEVVHLLRVIPSLGTLIDYDDSQQCEGQGCMDAQKRLHFLLCQFVDVISSFSEPVTLFIDDVQWADDASLEVINQLLLTSESLNESKKFYFLACMRLENINENPFCDMLSRVRQFGVDVTTVELACIDGDMTNTLISELLCLSPRLTRPLSDLIYHKTRGNLFFVSRLLMSLSKDGLLHLSLSRRRWDWDQEKIQSRQLSDDVASFLISTTQSLPKDVKLAMSVLSCFGVKCENAVVEALETVLGLSLIQPLELAVAEGLLDNIDGSYVFCHDKIQEAVYETIKPEERCLFHMKYGVALVPSALQLQADGIDDLLFIAANQINVGGPMAVADAEQAVVLANLNLAAGYSATEMSDYSSAFSFYDHGISFLRKKHWQEHYELSLQLFDAAAKAAFTIGDIDSLKLLTEQIFTFGKSLEDKLSSLYVLASALTYASQFLESIEKGVIVLQQLGEDFPEDVSESDVKHYLTETQKILANVTDDQLLNHEEMTDESKIMAMKFLDRLEHSMQIMRPELQAVCTLKMVHLSLSHGMSPFSPSGFTYYGMLLGNLGDIREGYRYVKIALKLLDRDGSEEVSGAVFALGTQVLSYVEPIHAAIELHLRGHDAAMAAGDTGNALLNKMLYVNGSFWCSSSKLLSVKENYSNLRRLMKQYRQGTWLTFLSVIEMQTLTLLGLEDDIDIAANVTTNPLAAIKYHFQNLYINYIFRRYDQMLLSAELFEGSNPKNWSLMYADSCQTFHLGLASFWVHRKSNDTKWFERGHDAKLAVARWTESSEWNFSSKLHLLEAEESFSKEDFDAAKLSYEKAISASKAHRFLNDEALACELAGYFFLEQGENEACLGYFLCAHEKYQEWGACAKANALFEFIKQDIHPSTIESIVPDIPDYRDDHTSNNRRRRVSE